MFKITHTDGVLQFTHHDAKWLSSGWNGGLRAAPSAYNISVPDPWDHTDLDSYAQDRRRQAGFSTSGPTLFTCVSQAHAYRATDPPVSVVATAGLSNPTTYQDTSNASPTDSNQDSPGTVNLLLGIDYHLPDHCLVEVLCGAIEAKTHTLYQETGIPSTTTDAAIAGCIQTGEQQQFAGSATLLGQAVRKCTRDAVLASLHSHYPDYQYPRDASDAEHGITLTGKTTITPVID